MCIYTLYIYIYIFGDARRSRTESSLGFERFECQSGANSYVSYISYNPCCTAEAEPEHAKNVSEMYLRCSETVLDVRVGFACMLLSRWCEKHFMGLCLIARNRQPNHQPF